MIDPFKIVFIGAAVFLSGASALRGEGSAETDIASALPQPVTEKNFAALKDQSPFLRSIGLSESIVVTGVAQMDGDVFASLFDLESRQTYLVGEEANSEGWQLVGIKGDRTDLESVTARIKIAGNEVVSIRYEKLSAKVFKISSSGISKSKSDGGGTGPHGGPDPRKLTRDQMDDAKRGAHHYREGFQADGYPDKPPPATVAKLSRLSTPLREAINVKMFEHRNRGLGLPERAKIYEGLLDRALQSKR